MLIGNHGDIYLICKMSFVVMIIRSAHCVTGQLARQLLLVSFRQGDIKKCYFSDNDDTYLLR